MAFLSSIVLKKGMLHSLFVIRLQLHIVSQDGNIYIKIATHWDKKIHKDSLWDLSLELMGKRYVEY